MGQRVKCNEQCGGEEMMRQSRIKANGWFKCRYLSVNWHCWIGARKGQWAVQTLCHLSSKNMNRNDTYEKPANEGSPV